MIGESITTMLPNRLCDFEIQHMSMSDDDERNVPMMSDSDTSSSTSAESPPGTMTMYEMGASLDDVDYIDDGEDRPRAGEGGPGRHGDGRAIEFASVNVNLKNQDENKFDPVADDDATAPADRSRREAIFNGNGIEVQQHSTFRVSGSRSEDATESGQTPVPNKRSLRDVRPLSSECLEGLDWGETRDGVNLSSGENMGETNTSGQMRSRFRERAESEPQRIPVPPSSRCPDPLAVSGAPSDLEQDNLLKQYSTEASSPPQVLQGCKSPYVPLDKRSWLELTDKHHRYGKNLRLYFKEWDRRGKPDGSFFKWLSTPEVQLDGCPRHELESDVVHYCHPEERHNYALRLHVTNEGRAILHTANGELVNSGPNAWLFVLRDKTIFATDKKTDPPRFHHSSFFGGEYVEAAGMLVAENGALVTLYPHSGHYRPTNVNLRRLLLFLRQLGVDLSAIQVDAQRVHKVARPDKKTERRYRKMDNPYMVSGRYLLDFFETKHKWWASGLFRGLCNKAANWHTQGGGSSTTASNSVDAEEDSGDQSCQGVGGSRACMHSGGGTTVRHHTVLGNAIKPQKRDSFTARHAPERGSVSEAMDAHDGRQCDEAIRSVQDSADASSSGGAMPPGGGGGGEPLETCSGGTSVGGSGGGILHSSPPPPKNVRRS